MLPSLRYFTVFPQFESNTFAISLLHIPHLTDCLLTYMRTYIHTFHYIILLSLSLCLDFSLTSSYLTYLTRRTLAALTTSHAPSLVAKQPQAVWHTKCMVRLVVDRSFSQVCFPAWLSREINMCVAWRAEEAGCWLCTVGEGRWLGV